ncbi:unnamed protein product [marine sediment metagenome]|uniref:Uncharacterized protein n=1 Tax=marine sediment metagenome TaxID=412755 RepID=X1PWQ2_9ZZZZ
MEFRQPSINVMEDIAIVTGYYPRRGYLGNAGNPGMEKNIHAHASVFPTP